MANEVRLINAVPIKKFILDGLNSKDPDKMFGHDAIEILAEIEYAQVIDPKSMMPKGRWELYPSHMRKRCSVCKFVLETQKFNARPNYCPNCGAKMEV